MSELFMPADNAVIDRRSEFYRATETFKRRSAASKAKMAKYWADKRHRRRVCKKLAKPVSAFDLQGNLVGTWPSSRKAAQALFPDSWETAQDKIRQCRRGERKRHKGYQFRDHQPADTAIEPYQRKPICKRNGYRKDNSYLHKPVRVTWPDGDHIDFESIKDTAAALQCRPSTISTYLHKGKPYKGKVLQFIENQ